MYTSIVLSLLLFVIGFFIGREFTLYNFNKKLRNTKQDTKAPYISSSLYEEVKETISNDKKHFRVYSPYQRAQRNQLNKDLSTNL